MNGSRLLMFMHSFYYIHSSPGAGNGGDNNPRVHSDGWQRRRGSGCFTMRAIHQNFSTVDYCIILQTIFLIFVPVYPDGAGEGQNSAQVHVDDEPRVAASYF